VVLRFCGSAVLRFCGSEVLQFCGSAVSNPEHGFLGSKRRTAEPQNPEPQNPRTAEPQNRRTAEPQKPRARDANPGFCDRKPGADSPSGLARLARLAGVAGRRIGTTKSNTLDALARSADSKAFPG